MCKLFGHFEWSSSMISDFSAASFLAPSWKFRSWFVLAAASLLALSFISASLCHTWELDAASFWFEPPAVGFPAHVLFQTLLTGCFGYPRAVRCTPTLRCRRARCSLRNQVQRRLRPCHVWDHPPQPGIILNEERNKKFFEKDQTNSLLQPHFKITLTLDDAEAKNDFWSITEDLICRHHVEPRVNLYVPNEESFPFPLKYIDVTRTTDTTLHVVSEKNIDDYWNVDGNRELSDAWTSFTRFIV